MLNHFMHSFAHTQSHVRDCVAQCRRTRGGARYMGVCEQEQHRIDRWGIVRGGTTVASRVDAMMRSHVCEMKAWIIAHCQPTMPHPVDTRLPTHLGYEATRHHQHRGLLRRCHPEHAVTRLTRLTRSLQSQTVTVQGGGAVGRRSCTGCSH